MVKRWYLEHTKAFFGYGEATLSVEKLDTWMADYFAILVLFKNVFSDKSLINSKVTAEAIANVVDEFAKDAKGKTTTKSTSIKNDINSSELSLYIVSHFNLLEDLNKDKCHSDLELIGVYLGIIQYFIQYNKVNLQELAEVSEKIFVSLPSQRTVLDLNNDTLHKYLHSLGVNYTKELVGNEGKSDLPLEELSALENVLNTLRSKATTALVNILWQNFNLDGVKNYLFGKKGIFTETGKSLATLVPEQRKYIGQKINAIKQILSQILSQAKSIQDEAELQYKLMQERIDVTLPVYGKKPQGLHPITQVLNEIVEIFGKLNFTVQEGLEIQTEENNFTLLNFDEFHPAKASHDTFYFKSSQKEDGNFLLRTHTSPVQVQVMQTTKPPIRIIAPGRVYRSDDDATHTPMFHQVEGLYVSDKVSVTDLKFTLSEFCKQFFELKEVPLRFRPSYFPFTTPSLEVDIACKRTKNNVAIGEGNDWLEILGCGMVHPNVLKNCNIDPEKYSGFAFGLGVERMAMLKYGFPDLREFFSSNYRWLQSYNFKRLGFYRS